MIFLTATLLLLYVPEIIGQEIVSTGQHSNEEFLWSVGVDNLSFNISFTGVTSINYATYNHDWSHISTDGEILVSFRTQIASSSLDRVLCYNGTNFNNPPYATAYGIDYKIDCALVGSTLESQFTIVSALNSSYDNSTLQVRSGAMVDTKALALKYCDDLSVGGNLTVTGGKNAEYNDIATYTCTDSVLVINETYDNTVSEYSRICQYDANWSNPQIAVDCWPVPPNPTTFGTYTQSALPSSATPASPSSSTTPVPTSCPTIPDCRTGGLSIGAAIAIGACVGIILGVVATSAVWWWLLKRVNKKPTMDERNEPPYEPTYVDGEVLEPAYDVINRETLEDGGQVVTQQRADVSAAYEYRR